MRNGKYKQLLTLGGGATYSMQPSLLGPWAAVKPSRQQPKLTNRPEVKKEKTVYQSVLEV